MKISFEKSFSEIGFLRLKGLYKIVNTVNGHWYVGSTSMGFAKRFRNHREKLRKGNHANPHLQNAYNKYGEKSFVCIVFKSSEDSQFREDEQRILDKHFGKPYCYNVSKEL